jgi:hypothetical protein
MTGEDDDPSAPRDLPGAPRDGAGQAGRRAVQTDRADPPPDAPDDPAVCSYCGARFVEEALLALHRGLEHGPELDEDERAAYAEAVAAERDSLRLFRLQALAALLVIYFGFVVVYAFVL